MSGLSPQIGVFQTNRLYSQAERYPNIHVVMRSITNGLSHWPDSWVGIGHIAVGMARQGYDFQLTRYDARGWRATFYTSGMEHYERHGLGVGTHVMARGPGGSVGCAHTVQPRWLG